MTNSEPDRDILEAWLLETARRDISAYNRLVYRTEEGCPWETTDFQREWHEIIDKYDRVVLFAPAGHGKSEQIARSWITRQMAENPNQHGAILCNELGAAKKRLITIREDIETNTRLQAVYPALQRHPSMPWTDAMLYCARDIVSKDPSLQAVGLHGAVIGARLHFGAIDDPCDFENTWTAAQREKALKWILSTFVTRFDGRGKIVVIITTWHKDDVGHCLVRDYGWKGFRYEACDETFGNILWPERFTEEILRNIHSGEGAIGEVEFSRTYRNRVMDDSFRRIQWEWIKTALMRGRGVKPGVRPEGAIFCATGLDPAGGKKKAEGRGDLCAFFTGAVFANGDRQVVHVEADRMTSPEMKQRIAAHHHQFGSKIRVEDNGVQVWLVQDVVQDTAIPIVGSTTTAKKWDPYTGVESIGIEMQQGKWIIPSTPDGLRGATPEIRAWIDEMLHFQIGAHTGDRLIASYLFRKEAREQESGQIAELPDIVWPGSSLVEPDKWSM